MTLLSITVFSWLAVTALLAWTFPRKRQPFIIALSTALFLVLYSPLSFLILTVNSLIIYHLARKGRNNASSLIALTGYVAAVFIWFKIKGTAQNLFSVEEYLMPLGLSYCSFRQIHYIFEAGKGKLERHGLMEYMCYLFFLPTIHVGPIHRFPEFLRDLRRRRWDYPAFSSGMERILYGYAKIVILGTHLISNRFAAVVAKYEEPHSLLHEYFRSIAYWLNLYFQFSGYSDVAIGFSLIMGFRIIENFDNPFLASNIGEFWQRWHISLTSWCRDYVYVPLAALTRRPYIALLAAMVIIGLWHEFSIRYVLWGIYHCLGLAVWHSFQKIKQRFPAGNASLKFPLHAASVFLTLNFVLASFTVTNFVYDKIRELF